jgi:hypothetical protein
MHTLKVTASVGPLAVRPTMQTENREWNEVNDSMLETTEAETNWRLDVREDRSVFVHS